MSKLFRGKLLAGIHQLHLTGKLKKSPSMKSGYYTHEVVLADEFFFYALADILIEHLLQGV